MATPDPGGPMRRRVIWLPLVGALCVAVVMGVVVAGGGGSVDQPGGGASSPVTEGAVEVASDAPRFATLDELVAASDLVVVGRVTATERGRWFGEGDSRIQSRQVSLEVDEVLSGDLRPGASTTVLVEEEGWLADGSPLVVDGAAPSATGDHGIWFLADTGDATTGAYIVVNAQGRYVEDGDTWRGADLEDPLIRELEDTPASDLATRIESR